MAGLPECGSLQGTASEVRPMCAAPGHTKDWKCHYLLFTTTEDKRLHKITVLGNSC